MGRTRTYLPTRPKAGGSQVKNLLKEFVSSIM